MVGLCFANGLTPISDKYGWRYGLFAAILHYYMVTMVPNLHGGFCLYNGGFTATLVCILLLPILEHHFRTKQSGWKPGRPMPSCSNDISVQKRRLPKQSPKFRKRIIPSQQLPQRASSAQRW